MEQDAGLLSGSLCVQQLDALGAPLKKTLFKSATFILGRNEFRDIILKIEASKKSFKFVMRDNIIHKKFVREGKATIVLSAQRVQLMLSNCPPDKLIMFLKTLSTKFECLKLSGFTSERKKLLSELPRTFQEISPLNMKDLQTVHSARTKAAEQEQTKSSSSVAGKRKRPMGDDKENIHPKVNIS